MEPGSTRLQVGAADEPTPVGQPAIDALAALVPAETLAAHGALLQAFTRVDNNTFLITDASALRFSFWGLLGASLVLYIILRASTWDRFDYLRMLIPPLALAVWMTLQNGSALDAVVHWQSGLRLAIPIIGALILGAAARSLAYKADERIG